MNNRIRWGLTHKENTTKLWNTTPSGDIVRNFVTEPQEITIDVPQITEILQGIKPENKLTFWSEWEIYKVLIHVPWGQMKVFLVAKKRYDNNVKHEYETHQKAYKLLCTRDDVWVWVPKLYSKFESIDGSQLIIMEYVSWQTLYAKIIDMYIKTFCAWHFERKQSSSRNDKEAEQSLLDHFHIEKVKGIIDDIIYNPYKYTTESGMLEEWKKLWHSAGKTKHPMVLFTKEVWNLIQQQLWEFFTIMHDAGIYHRDIGANLRNIIIWKNNKPYIIDFGKAKDIGHDPYIPEAKIYQGSNSNDLPFARDEEIIDIISAYTEK